MVSCGLQMRPHAPRDEGQVHTYITLLKYVRTTLYVCMYVKVYSNTYALTFLFYFKFRLRRKELLLNGAKPQIDSERIVRCFRLRRKELLLNGAKPETDPTDPKWLHTSCVDVVVVLVHV